ncbi:Uma2 family endonuclease [Desulfurispora thermophila]|uniref:Uma2 family endonuclease n=1 Tax=Desulfurispora thermophila TaxID=265470 RepID=UPI00037C0AF5|nr:Uma2 family endonuclease [Desulfurispora thermophila]
MSGGPYTYADYCLTEEGGRCFLMEGELVMVPAPRTVHQRISKMLQKFIDRFVESHSLGEVLYAPLDVYLSEKDVLQPDIVFISRDRLHIITEENIQGAPDLVIEILSPATARYDKVTKSRLYYRYGVQEYWLVDPDGQVVQVFQRGERYWNLYDAFAVDHTLTSPLLPGLEIPLAQVFAPLPGK